MILTYRTKIILFCLILAYVVYGIFAPNNSIPSNNVQSKVNPHNSAKLSDKSIFSVQFLDAAEYQRRLSNGILNDTNFQQNSHNVLENIVSKKNMQQAIVGDFSTPNNGSGASSSATATESSSLPESDNNVIINDLTYQKTNSNDSSALNTSFGETVFISDSAQNTLMSCVDENGVYKCHVALSNLNNPQDILVVRNHLYLINSSHSVESGAIVKCNINNYGYIDNCNHQRINIINPIFFYSHGASIYISDMVYAGDGKINPTSALQCTLDGAGNLINCNPDKNILSAYFIRKTYNNSYYHTNAFHPPASIERCATIDAVNCTHLTNDLFVYPLALSINHDRFFITNQHADSSTPEVLKCTLDMKKCVVVTNMQAPTAIGVYNFQH